MVVSSFLALWKSEGEDLFAPLLLRQSLLVLLIVASAPLDTSAVKTSQKSGGSLSKRKQGSRLNKT
jgi:hypothetical protein